MKHLREALYQNIHEELVLGIQTESNNREAAALSLLSQWVCVAHSLVWFPEVEVKHPSGSV